MVLTRVLALAAVASFALTVVVAAWSEGAAAAPRGPSAVLADALAVPGATALERG